MSEAQQLTPSLTTSPKLAALPQPQALATEDFVVKLLHKRLESIGLPQPIAAELEAVADKAAKKVPNWVIYIILAFGGPLFTWGITQYDSYKDLPAEVSALKDVQSHQGQQLDRIEDLLSPTSRPKEGPK
jgi:hypothetical protein